MDVSELRKRLRDGRVDLFWEAVVAVGQSALTLRESTGWAPIGTLVPELKTEARVGHARAQKQNDENPCVASFVFFKCVRCRSRVRADVSEVGEARAVRCGNCDAAYSIERAESDGSAFLIVPVSANGQQIWVAKIGLWIVSVFVGFFLVPYMNIFPTGYHDSTPDIAKPLVFGVIVTYGVRRILGFLLREKFES
jgi:hypothetical protein